MKNKEIEELLKGMRDVSNTEGCSMNLDRYLVKLLLSYIEQLEKDKKELKDGWQQEIYDKNKVLNDWLEDERKINILQNNRDKAIEYINKTVFNEKGYINFCYELENILKGDSDE